MADPLTQADLARIEAAIREAERDTSAELVVVIAREPVDPADDGGTAPLWPALAALLAPLPLLLLAPRLPASAVYAVQLAVLALGLLLVLLPPVRDRLSPPVARGTRVRAAARDQFFERGLHLTAARTGVLLFVSPADRAAELIADAGVQGPLPDETWRPCLDELTARARDGRLADGIEAAVARVGTALREKLPAGPADRNEVADTAVVL